MNNIELEQLKKDVRKYLGNDELAERVGLMKDDKLNKLKKELLKITNKAHTNKAKHQKTLQIQKITEIISTQTQGEKIPAKTITTKSVSQSVSSDSNQVKTAKDSGAIVVPAKQTPKPKKRRISVPASRKPKILLIADVKNWAWWLKGEYLQKYLSDEFDIDLVCVLGPGCTNQYAIPQNKYDLYFTFGYSYIDFLYSVPKFKKATGVTAHRPPNVIKPKMMQAGHLHANSMLLLKELINMGFVNAHYVPNGVNEEMFRPIKPIPKERQRIMCGHVGKECPAKGQKEIIYPAIAQAGGDRVTSVVTWKQKIPHDQMYKIYQEMDVFIVASLEDGTPNPALEAAACGRPIISNRIGNMPELIEDGVNGFIVDRRIPAYVEKISYLQSHRDELIRMGKKARETIEKYWTWKVQSERYRKMFREIFIVKGG